MLKVSPLAIVADGAKLADDVVVGPFACIGPDVRVGPGCVIGSSATLVGRTVLTRDTSIFSMAVVGTAPDGGSDGVCRIGPETRIREHVTIYAGSDDAPTSIGPDNRSMNGCQIGAGATLCAHGIFANYTQIGPGARIEDYVRTSGFTFIEPNVTVGAYTFTAGYADVDRDAPPFAMVQGCPFRVRGVNTLNLKRCGFADEDIRALKSAFREIFSNNSNNANGNGARADEAAIASLLAEEDLNPRVRQLIDALGKAHGPKVAQDD